MRTCYGILADEIGHASTRDLEQGPNRPELRFRAWATPSTAYAAIQDPEIRVDQDHSHVWCGEAVYLERDRQRRLWLVAHVDSHVRPHVAVRVAPGSVVEVPTPFWWSSETIGSEDAGILLQSVALTPSPARVCPGPPLKFMDGDLDYQREPPSSWRLEGYERELLTRACEAKRSRKRGDPLIIHDLGRDNEAHVLHDVRSAPPLEIRSAEPVGVSTTTRTIEVVVAPYHQAADVVHRGKWVKEVYLPGSFDQVERQGNKVRVLRDHAPERVCGRATAFHPQRLEGLVCELRIAETELGNETLALASEDCLSASAGFRVLEERWQGQETRLVAKAWLDHVGLTPQPAYSSADVLDVRGHDFAGVRL